MNSEQSHNMPLKQPHDVARWEQLAQDAASREALTEAADALRKAAELEPHNIERWIRIARWQRQNGDSSAAQSTLEAAIAANRQAETLPLWLALAELQLQSQQWEACIASCRAALQLHPRDHFALEMQATALLHNGDMDASLRLVEQLLRLSPRDPLHRMRLATLLQIQGRAGEALREWETVTAMYPDSPFSSEAEEAIDMLDRAQIHHVLLRAADERHFAWQLQRDIDTTLEDNNFYLSDGGMETLRQLIWDGRPDEIPTSEIPRFH
jgi:cytochrome c-type biogenesis protein CcmH/NrfG